MTAHKAAAAAIANALCEGTHRGVLFLTGRPCEEHERVAVRALAAFAASPDVRAALVAAIEDQPETCHAGSLRGISSLYCYVPVLDAVHAVMAALGGTDDEGAT